MTMTLDEVRKTRFHMSRRSGYEVTDVDIFVDKVEETLQLLTTENEDLRRQLSETEPSGSNKDVERLRHQMMRYQEDATAYKNQVTHLQGELEKANTRAAAAVSAGSSDQTLMQEVETLRSQLSEAQAQLADAQHNAVGRDQYLRLTGENTQLREQLERLVATEKLAEHASRIAVTTSPEASSAVVRLVQLATEQADNLVSEATTEAARRRESIEEEIKAAKDETDMYVNRVRSEAEAHAAQVKSEAQFAAEEMLRKSTESAVAMGSEAQAKAERIDREARINAERLVQEAQQRAVTFDSEIAARRSEVFGALDHERDALFAKVEKLRTYEKSFRQTMTGYLKSQIERLESSQFAPEEAPDLLQTPARTANEWNTDSASATPRLDALLED